MNYKEFKIGDTFQILRGKIGETKYCNVEVIGIYYTGIGSSDSLQTKEELMTNGLTKYIQFLCEPYYDFCPVSQTSSKYNSFIKDIEEDTKLKDEFRRYKFN